MRSNGLCSCWGWLFLVALAFAQGCGSQQKGAKTAPPTAENKKTPPTVAYRQAEPGEENKGESLDNMATNTEIPPQKKTHSRVVPAVVNPQKPSRAKQGIKKSPEKVKSVAAKSRIHEGSGPQTPETSAASPEGDGSLSEPAPLARSARAAKPMAAKPAEEQPIDADRSAAVPPSPAVPKMAATGNSASAPETSPTTGTFSSSEDGNYCIVRVFYGTDRAAVDPASVKKPLYYIWLLYTLMAGAVSLILASLAFYFWPRLVVKILAGLGVAITLLLGALTGYVATQGKLPGAVGLEQAAVAYGPDRGKLELGTCEVSIPKEHKTGELESPSVIRLEFREDPKKHVVLLNVARQPTDEFFDQLKTCVGLSSQKAAFVFVHGYKVSFEDAARRTAQMAYDLKFDGAPIFFSWPSQASMLGYTVDETNVEWSVPHLMQFLTDLAQKSGARQVHLVAHSMGNRALTSALSKFAAQPELSRPKFNEVLLTAPDVDADTFKDQIAPVLSKTAQRVTLYASSNDEALAASKTLHGGYARAGESGKNLVVVPGVETIDVSAVDTSLLGHSYYGDNRSVLADIFEVLHDAKSPSQRTWLREAKRGLDRYWIFAR